MSSIWRAICTQRSASRPPPMTAKPRISTQNQKSEGSSKQLAQVHVLARGLGKLEQLGLLEVERARHDQVRKCLRADVVQIHPVVVELAPVGDRLLDFRDAALQVRERRVCPERGVILGYGEQTPEARAELFFGSADRRDVLLTLRARDGRPRLHDALECLLLVFHV